MRSVFLLTCALLLRAQEPAWRAEVKVVLPGPMLEVDLRLASGDDDDLHIADGCGAFVDHLQREIGGVWKDVPWSGDEGSFRHAERDGLHLRYRFRAGEAAASMHRLMLITGQGDDFLLRPPAFLIRPRRYWPSRQARLEVTSPPGWRFLSGLRPDGKAYVATAEAMDDAPYSALGRFETTSMKVGGDEVVWAMPEGLTWDRAVLETWIERSAKEVAWAFGGSPMPRYVLFLWPSSRGRGVGFGTAAGMGGGGVIVLMGATWKAEDLTSDWVLSHELTHLGLPTLDPDHRWLEEGLPTYLEPMLALRAGRITPERFWGDLMRELPQGQPASGDRGLDHTPTWGRTYWGGALFFFLADLELREHSKGRVTLLDALRGLHREGLNAESACGLQELLATLDRGVGKGTFTALHGHHGSKAEKVDLEAIWLRLGIQVKDGKVRFSEDAPAAHLRRAWIEAIR